MQHNFHNLVNIMASHEAAHEFGHGDVHGDDPGDGHEVGHGVNHEDGHRVGRGAVVMSDTSNRYSDQISVVSRIAKSSGSEIGSMRL